MDVSGCIFYGLWFVVCAACAACTLFCAHFSGLFSFFVHFAAGTIDDHYHILYAAMTGGGWPGLKPDLAPGNCAGQVRRVLLAV